MAYVNKAGKRWQGCYRDANGAFRVAGSDTSKRRALALAQDEEAKLRVGDWTDPVAAKLTFGEYFEQHWLPQRGGEIIFTSDNGYFLGEQGERQGKILPYEPSLRVPLVMRGPGIPKGEVRTDPWLSIDYAPTLATCPTPGATHGWTVVRCSTWPGWATSPRAACGAGPPSPRPSRRTPPQIKLQRKDPVGAHTERLLQGKTTGIRTGRFLYTEWLVEPGDKNPGATVELYDVLKDPKQYDNLADDEEYADTVAELHEVLAKARRCRAEGCHALLPSDLR